MSYPPPAGGRHPFRHPHNPLESQQYQRPPQHLPFEPLPAPVPRVNHRRHLALTLCTLGVWGVLGWVPLLLWRRPRRSAGLVVTGYYGVLVAAAAAVAIGLGGMSGGKGGGLTPAGGVSTPDAHPVLTDSGGGSKRTDSFQVRGSWQVKYTYDCSSTGSPGNFALSLRDSRHPGTLVDLMANALGANGADVVRENRAGTYFLAVDSQCDWSLEIDSLS